MHSKITLEHGAHLTITISGQRSTSRAGEGSQVDDTGSRVSGVAGDESSDDDEVLEMYFKEPQQLLNIFTELEEKNLSLIQNSQETEEALEELKQNIKQTQKKMYA